MDENKLNNKNIIQKIDDSSNMNGHSRNSSLDSDIKPILNPYITKIFDQNDPFTSRRLSGFLNPEAVNILESQLKNVDLSGANSTSTSKNTSSLSLDGSNSNLSFNNNNSALDGKSTTPSIVINTSSSKVISNKALIKKPSSLSTSPSTIVEDDESSSSEEEYEVPLPKKPTASLVVPTRLLTYLDLGDVIVLKILGYLHSDDLCSLQRANKYYCNIISQSQVLWKNLNIYYMKTFTESTTSTLVGADINLWEEEMYTPPTSIGTVKLPHHHSNSSNNNNHHGGGSSSSSNTPSKSLDNKLRSQTISNIANLPKLLGDGISTVSGLTSISKESNSSKSDKISILDKDALLGKPSSSSNSSQVVTSAAIENIDANILILNNLIRKLTPTTSVPSTTEIQEFVDGCHLYPIRLLIRKLIQRYLVPREFNANLPNTEWQKIVERPVQLRVGKILRKVVDQKQVVFDYPSILLLKTFIKGYLQPQSEMSRGLNQGLSKKVKSAKAWEITRLSESLLSKVFRNLELTDLSLCNRVCKKWHKTIQNSDLWEQLYHYYRRKLLKSFVPADINIWEDPSLNCFDSIFVFLAQTSPMIMSPSPMSSIGTSPVPSSGVFSPTLQSSTPPQIVTTFPPLPPKPPPLSLPTSFSDDNITYLSNEKENSHNQPHDSSNSSLELSSIVQKSISASTSPQPPTPPPPPPPPTKSNNNRHMNLNQIVDKLTSVSFVSDISEVNAFLATYRNFITTPQLVEKLLQRYHVPRPNNLNFSILDWRQKIEGPIQHKVCKVLKKVIDDHFSDFNPLVLAVFKIFLQHIIDKHSTLTSHLIRSFSKKLFYKETSSTADDEKKLKSSKSQSKIGWMIPSVRKPIFTDLLTMSADDIARQLTLIEFEIYSKIQTSEFINQAWAKEKTRHLAPNIRAAIDRFNLITKWVCTVILKEEKIRSRTKVMSKLIKVAKTLRSFANYHTLMAILSGLNEAPLFRLKHTQAELKPKVQKLATELQTLMSVEGNHDAYRTELATVDQKQSCIPYLGVYLKDITFLQDDTNKAADGGINMKQSKNIYNVLKIIQIFQKNPYSFEEYPKVKDSLQNLQILTEDNLYLLSYSREPKNSKRSDLI